MKTTGLAVALMLTMTAGAGAHEGHDERVLGTVAAVDASSIAVKTKEGKTVRVALDAKTVVLRGDRTVTPADIVVGERAVVSVGSRKNTHVAKEIRLAGQKER